MVRRCTVCWLSPPAVGVWQAEQPVKRLYCEPPGEWSTDGKSGNSWKRSAGWESFLSSRQRPIMPGARLDRSSDTPGRPGCRSGQANRVERHRYSASGRSLRRRWPECRFARAGCDHAGQSGCRCDNHSPPQDASTTARSEGFAPPRMVLWARSAFRAKRFTTMAADAAEALHRMRLADLRQVTVTGQAVFDLPG